MVTGQYDVSLKTPMGVKKGILELSEEGGTVKGKMIVMGKENPIEPGTTDGTQFTFSGKLKTALGMTPYTCEGSVDGDVISGTVKTKKGDMPMSGKRK